MELGGMHPPSRSALWPLQDDVAGLAQCLQHLGCYPCRGPPCRQGVWRDRAWSGSLGKPEQRMNEYSASVLTLDMPPDVIGGRQNLRRELCPSP